jgi:hypothetical protein
MPRDHSSSEPTGRADDAAFAVGGDRVEPQVDGLVPVRGCQVGDQHAEAAHHRGEMARGL